MSETASASVDASLWWDPFSVLLAELEQVPPSSSSVPLSLIKKLKDNHDWFLDTVSRFKPANQKSRDALNSKQLKIGLHLLSIKPEIKDAALRTSDLLCLDEVQSYILNERTADTATGPVDSTEEEFLHLVLLQYYIERQCLLKCTRQILVHALYVGMNSKEDSSIKEEALKIIADGLERKLFDILQELLCSSHPQPMDVNLFTLWAEETLTEDNLILDILFLAYYESLCTCTAETWKKFCSTYKEMVSGTCNFGRLAVSAEATCSIYHAKVQLLLILVETLNLENLLQMIHDDMPVRQGLASFSLTDIQEIDTLISDFSVYETREAGPLVLAWAVFLCLILSLPDKQQDNVLEDIDHIGYVRQAFEAAPLNYLLDVIQSDLSKFSDGPVAGYQSVLRTFISSFIACYEINLQLEDTTLKLILEILCNIYRGEESLCNQFWDRDSFIDGPIRCLLCNLEGEFPFRIVELVRLLSALSEGTWPAECVYSFLNKSVGLSTLFEMTSDSLVDNVSHVVELQRPLNVPGFEGLIVPSRTRGHVLKVIDGSTALVRWEHAESGVFLLVLRLAQELHLGSVEDVRVILDLLSRLTSFNKAVCFALLNIAKERHFPATTMNELMEDNLWCRVDLAEIICTLIKNCKSAEVMSLSVNILANILKCSPTHVTTVALKANIFDLAVATNVLNVGSSSSSSGPWSLSGRLAKLILIDCEINDNSCPLAISVVGLTMQLIETGSENDDVFALVLFCLQYIFVNHEYWKYKVKSVRWRVTMKVLELIKKCILLVPLSCKMSEIVRNILLSDSSVHNTLFRIVCTTPEVLEKLYVSRLYDPMEIEGLELAMSSAMDVIYTMVSKLCKDLSSGFQIFHQVLLSSTTKPLSIGAAMMSLISHFRNSGIQVGAARVLSVLFTLADCSQPYLSVNACFGLEEKQISKLRYSISRILHVQSSGNENLTVAIVKFLTSAACYQPAVLVSIAAAEDTTDIKLSDISTTRESLIERFVQYIERSDDLIDSNPCMLLNILLFFKSLWQGAASYATILELLKSSGNFWSKLCKSAILTESPSYSHHRSEDFLMLAYKYQCQSSILELMACEMFLHKKLLQAELLTEKSAESTSRIESVPNPDNLRKGYKCVPNDIISSWSENSSLGTLIKSSSSCDYDSVIYARAKVSINLFTVCVMEKFAKGDSGSLSMSLVEKISSIAKKLSIQPAFSELVSQYSRHGYSEGNELSSLILSDLFYHLQGELEGRDIISGPFKELSQYLLKTEIQRNYQLKYDDDLSGPAKGVYLFDTERLRQDLGLDMWDHSEWRVDKEIPEKMLLYMEEANSMALAAASKLSALKALVDLLVVCEGTSEVKIGRVFSEQLVDHICQCLQGALQLLSPLPEAYDNIIDFISAQTELVLTVFRMLPRNPPLSTCARFLRTSCSGLKVLREFMPSGSRINVAIEFFLMLTLSSVKSCLHDSAATEVADLDPSEVSTACTALLPILCSCVETSQHSVLSLAIMDLVIRHFLTPNTWLPIIKGHLRLQHVLIQVQGKHLPPSVPMLLKFLLTLAHATGGAEMLLSAGFFSSLRALFSDLSDGMPLAIQNGKSFSASSENVEQLQNIWGLGLAVVTAMVCSLRDSSLSFEFVDSAIHYLFLEKAHIVSYYLNAPDFSSDFHDKKRARAPTTLTSLTTLRETEHTLMVMCALAKHWKSWVKIMKDSDSELREKSIHLLAFISRGSRRMGEHLSRTPPLLCLPNSKEEMELQKKPSFIQTRSGWFGLCHPGSASKSRLSGFSRDAVPPVTSQPLEKSNQGSQTYFSDMMAIQMYKIAFLLLKFLCLQAEGAAKRAEEKGFVDLAHFPELPVPEILHGLQDQAISIVTGISESSKSKKTEPEAQSLCLLLLQILEMALYLELCVSQICGMKPVSGRVEEFSKEAKLLFRAIDAETFLKRSTKSLKQIISLAYPELSRSEGFF